MKKTWTLKFGAFVLVLTLISASLVGGTIAKYTSIVAGTDTAQVAKWAFTINGEPLNLATGEGSRTFTFNLFNTIHDTLGGVETDVAEPQGSAAPEVPLIAPGTTGSFPITIKNTGDVTAEYFIRLINVTELPDYNDGINPLQFAVTTGDEQPSWVRPLGGGVVQFNGAAKSGNIPIGDEITITVHWQWAITQEADDEGEADDTNLGVNPIEISATAEITLTQVD